MLWFMVTPPGGDGRGSGCTHGQARHFGFPIRPFGWDDGERTGVDGHRQYRHPGRLVARVLSSRLLGLSGRRGVLLKGERFIDASYEGDVLESAGVSFVVGREANAQYGETGNGITGALRQNQLRDGVDPFV